MPHKKPKEASTAQCGALCCHVTLTIRQFHQKTNKTPLNAKSKQNNIEYVSSTGKNSEESNIKIITKDNTNCESVTDYGSAAKGNKPLFTARCILVQSAVLRLHVVCLSVCDVGEL